METTYRHLSDNDAVEHAAAKFEGREPEQESPLSPEICPTCGEILGPNAKACEACGEVFTLDAKQAKDQIESDMKRSYKETEPGDTETMEKIDALDDLLNDTEVKAALLEELQISESTPKRSIVDVPTMTDFPDEQLIIVFPPVDDDPVVPHSKPIVRRAA